ncbi:MAG: response regulator transcription factor [Chloroflexi bacterium]|nr:response regulator transcription factor [Chloroflexota bacterium]
MPQPVRLLVVDDHPLFRAGVRERLAGFASSIKVVGEAANGQEAVELAARLRPDLVLMDIAMPGMNGIEATRRIKQHQSDVAVLVLTVYDDDQYVFALLDAGAAGYLLKTVEAKELAVAILRVQEGEPVLSPAVARKVLDRFARRVPSDERTITSRPLSEREEQVLQLTTTGASNKEIACQLGLSVRTVQAHMSHIFGKLGVASRTEAVIYGLRHGWLHIED